MICKENRLYLNEVIFYVKAILAAATDPAWVTLSKTKLAVAILITFFTRLLLDLILILYVYPVSQFNWAFLKTN